MKTYKNILFVIYLLIEIFTIILFATHNISSKLFILITLSMSLMIGLYFLDKNKVSSK